MDFVMVFPLILALLSTGQSYTEMTEQTRNSCYALCPAGHYKVGDCNDSVAIYRCEMCKDSTYTEIENFRERCLRCKACKRDEDEIKSCTVKSDVVCALKTTPGPLSTHAKTPDNTRITRKPTSINPPATTSTTILKTLTARATSIGTSASNNSSNPSMNPVPPVNQLPWLVFLGVIVIILVLFWILLFTSCPGWSRNKDPEPSVEDPILKKLRNHQENSPTTLTFNITEETSMMTLSPATLEHATHLSPLMPDSEHKAARQDEQSEHWPAIVLYAIIKEVPLRRWKEFLRLLSVADQQLDRVELEASLALSSMERQYQMLRLWSQRSSASLSDVFSALHYMDLSGCAQLLQESLEKLQWSPKQKHVFEA